jgi:hypothetical protein
MDTITHDELYNSLINGAKEVMNNRLFLNNINVFPVADGDTGSNLFSTMNSIVYHSELKENTKTTLESIADSAIIGEAAGYGLGLVMLGSANENAIEEMITHANDSKHEKIIRALSISLALIMYGKEDNADGLIEQMVRSKDSIMRYGAMFAIGCAYAGTNNNTAV